MSVMLGITYHILQTHSNITWLCCQCGMPSFSSSLFNTTPIDLSKVYQWRFHPWLRRQEPQRLIDISLDHNIEQTIDKPTRGGNILDLLFTNNKSTLQNFVTMLPLGKSDHDIINMQKLMFGLTGCALLTVKYLYFGKQTGMELNGN